MSETRYAWFVEPSYGDSTDGFVVHGANLEEALEAVGNVIAAKRITRASEDSIRIRRVGALA